jgi:hypothetical protein
MVTLAKIMNSLADEIRNTITGVTDINVQVEARMILSPSPPTIDIYPTDPSDDQALAAFGEKIGGELLTIRARVSTADTNAGQDLLLAFMDDEDPLSIINAVTDPTLNGRAATLAFRSRSGYRDFPDLSGEGSWLGCLWNLVVVKASS